MSQLSHRVNTPPRVGMTWAGKFDRPNLKPHKLVEVAKNSYGKERDSMIVHGDNLLALKALEKDFTGKIRCVYIDPPYNTGRDFKDYEDDMARAFWLSFMRDRLEVLRKLLRDDGSIWVHLDDAEAAYTKVLMDEVFGRKNFVSTIIWQRKAAYNPAVQRIAPTHDIILLYAKNDSHLKLNRLAKTGKQLEGYKNPDNDPRGVWKSNSLFIPLEYGLGHTEPMKYAYERPNGSIVEPPTVRQWRFPKAKMDELLADNRLWFGKDGSSGPTLKRFKNEVDPTVPATSIWLDAGSNQESKKENAELFGEDFFATPKPESLMERVFTVGSDPGDWIIDIFGGSGTSAASAHKMGRKWITCELGDQAVKHIVPRMKQVVDGKDPGGITKSQEWQGGGGFRFYRLEAESACT